MKIKVKYDVSATQRYESFDLEDLGVSEEKWNNMIDEEKRQLLMDAAETDQPYWVVSKFESEEQLLNLKYKHK